MTAFVMGIILDRRHIIQQDAMGLRSRQRRLAGVSHEDSFDVETSSHRVATLNEHLQASRRDVDDLNLAWKSTVGMAGLVMAVYEGGLYAQTLVVAKHAPVSAPLCFLFKLLAIASVLSTRSYVLSGQARMFGGSVVATAAYALLWAASFWLLALRFTLLQVSPIPLVYFVLSHVAVALIGGNTRAEIARAQQLEKLERVYNSGK